MWYVACFVAGAAKKPTFDSEERIEVYVFQSIFSLTA
jgi:hypothetical protein